MNKWPRCEDCVRDNYLRAPVCQTCVAGSNFLPRGRSKIYYESVQEMNQPPAAYRAMVQALRRFDDSALVPEILDVMFNEPATIVFWADGTKTVVKAVYDEFDPEKGLADGDCEESSRQQGQLLQCHCKVDGRVS